MGQFVFCGFLNCRGALASHAESCHHLNSQSESHDIHLLQWHCCSSSSLTHIPSTAETGSAILSALHAFTWLTKVHSKYPYIHNYNMPSQTSYISCQSFTGTAKPDYLHILSIILGYSKTQRQLKEPATYVKDSETQWFGVRNDQLDSAPA